jgi:hypothetical protein
VVLLGNSNHSLDQFLASLHASTAQNTVTQKKKMKSAQKERLQQKCRISTRGIKASKTKIYPQTWTVLIIRDIQIPHCNVHGERERESERSAGALQSQSWILVSTNFSKHHADAKHQILHTSHNNVQGVSFLDKESAPKMYVPSVAPSDLPPPPSCPLLSPPTTASALLYVCPCSQTLSLREIIIIIIHEKNQDIIVEEKRSKFL